MSTQTDYLAAVRTPEALRVRLVDLHRHRALPPLGPTAAGTGAPRLDNPLRGVAPPTAPGSTTGGGRSSHAALACG